jgi:pimeloyl-ACP methyl ester carboxylesterase
MKFLVQQQPAYAYTGGRPFDGARPSVIFIHGSANDHSVWPLQARYFAHHGFNALAVDLPGHGRSFGSAKSSIHDYADWLSGLIDTGGMDRAALVGHSMGALIALDVAIRQPQRVSSLALLGASYPMPVADSLLDAARHQPAEAIDMLNIWGHSPQAKSGASAIPGSSLLMAGKRLLEKSRPGVLANDLAACRDYNLADADFSALSMPTLIISGSQDLLTSPKASEALARRIGGARLARLDGVGHAMMQEAPGKVLDVLRSFLAP